MSPGRPEILLVTALYGDYAGEHCANQTPYDLYHLLWLERIDALIEPSQRQLHSLIAIEVMLSNQRHLKDYLSAIGGPSHVIKLARPSAICVSCSVDH